MAERKRTYGSWRNMMARCLNPAHTAYQRYGGRGISVCAEWRNFDAFVRDMGYRPSGRTLERIDNSKGYSPENCKWATAEEQAINRRHTHFVTFAGKTQTVRHWERELGLSRGAINQRLRRGWNIERAIAESTRPSELIKVAAKRRAAHVH